MRYQNFKELLEINAKQYPQGTVFLVDDEGKKAVTWQSFYDCVQARAEVLSKEKSTCIGILCENAYACMVETFAANQAGKQIVLLDALASSEILKQQIQASDADQLYGAGERSAELSEALTKGCTDGKGKILFFYQRHSFLCQSSCTERCFAYAECIQRRFLPAFDRTGHSIIDPAIEPCLWFCLRRSMGNDHACGRCFGTRTQTSRR
jgi:long-subunit acyl-CoA synthetase (AMP-forming)